MSQALIALELNDAGLQLARAVDGAPPETVGEESPGVALLHEGRVLTGRAAAALQRIAPLHVQNRYWQSLDTAPLPWQAGGVSTAADLAHAQLSALLEAAGVPSGTPLLMAVPPGWSREQLGLLVGIANESGASVRGLVDLGLAACADAAAGPHVLHLDLQLHQAALTVLESARGEGVLRRARYELLPGAGLLAVHNALAARIAAAFVAATRFDPLHQGATEQRLHERLPGWLDRLAQDGTTEATLEFGAATHSVLLQGAQLEDAVAPLVDELMRRVQATRPAGTALQLCFTPRIAGVPGLLRRLGALRDCVLVQLPPGAAARGALRHAAAVLRPPESIALVHRLPLAALRDAADAPAAEAVPAASVPTHVLFRGSAVAIRGEPLALGWSLDPSRRGLSLPAGVPGLSRSHCTLELHDGQAWVTDHSTYGTFVNDERVAGRVALRVGDALRLGAPGIVLELIRVTAD